MEILKVTLLGLVWASLSIVECSARPTICGLPLSFLCSSPKLTETCKVSDVCTLIEVPQKHDAVPRVNFTLYYESLCPDCRLFIGGQLNKAFHQIGDIIKLELVPYGNAEERQVGDHWHFDCQHGPQECVGNLIETCAISIVNNIKKVFPFIHCMEINKQLPEEAAKTCAKQFPEIPIGNILSCANGTKGNQLEHQMALKTDALQPPHQYVPWVTLNGVHTEAIEDAAEKDLVKLICGVYKGQKPAGCSQPSASRCYRQIPE